MKMMWCWRCAEDVPMLDETEYAGIASLYSECIKATKAYREQHRTRLEDTPWADLYAPVRQE